MDLENLSSSSVPENAAWKEAVCTFHSGAERRLLAEIRSPQEIFVITMEPPALRDIVSITFFGGDKAAGRQVEAVVTDIAYHPSEVRRCGFAAMVTDFDGTWSYAPGDVLRSVDVEKMEVTAKERQEKRRDPRIRVKVLTAVHLPGRTLSARIINLSMSGALLGFDRDQIPPEVTVGSLFRLDAYDTHGDISVCAKAEVIRLIGVGRPTNAGVRFIDLDEEVKRGIESIMLREVYFQSLAESARTE